MDFAAAVVAGLRRAADSIRRLAAHRTCVVLLLGALAGCANVRISPRIYDPVHVADRPVAALDERLERQLLGGHNEPSRLLELAPGDPSRGITVTVHGINSSPAEISALTDYRIARAELARATGSLLAERSIEVLTTDREVSP